MEAWMRELGVAMNLTELGVTEADLDDVVAAIHYDRRLQNAH